MTRDDIIRMALEADLLDERDALADPIHVELIVYLEHFAHLVAAAERNALGAEMWEKAMKLVSEAVKFERDRCIGIIHGQCGSDNVAQRTVDAIRSQS